MTSCGSWLFFFVEVFGSESLVPLLPLLDRVFWLLSFSKVDFPHAPGADIPGADWVNYVRGVLTAAFVRARVPHSCGGTSALLAP